MKKLLLHTCCAPCSIAVIDELKNQFDLTVFFYNPNIFPEAEYLKRKNEVIKICTEWNIPMVDQDYEPEKWDQAIAGLENEPEGGARCPQCFIFRMERAADFANQNKFEYFATSLSSGRNKKPEVINAIGDMLEKKYGTIFLKENWKSGGRQEKGRKMVSDRGIYRQTYCGCKYSIK